MSKLQKLIKLSCHQWSVLLSNMILLPLLGLALRVYGFKVIYNIIITHNNEQNSQDNISQAQYLAAKNFARMINIAAAYGPYRASCLTRSLFLLHILLRHNIPCNIVIGANTSDNPSFEGFSAHAWVESAGLKADRRILNDQSNITARFKAFSLPLGAI